MSGSRLVTSIEQSPFSTAGPGRSRGQSSAPTRGWPRAPTAGEVLQVLGESSLTCRPVTLPDGQVPTGPAPAGSHGRRPLAAVASTLVAAALLTTAPDAASASGLRIDAAAGGRLSARLVATAPPGALEYVLDDRLVRQTRRREISIPVRRGKSGPGSRAVWRKLEVRRARSGHVLAKARFAMARRSSRRAPTLILLGAPRARTERSTAVLRFSTTAKKTSCSRDGAAVRRCSSPASYERLSPGTHTFSVRTANRHGKASIRVASTVVAAAPPAPGPTPGDPTPATPVFSDDFEGTALNTANWSRYSAPYDGGRGLRRPGAISLDGKGNLVITAQMVDGQLVSGGMALVHNYTYGRYEVRVRTDPDPTATMSGVVLTWPQSGNWPQDGEERHLRDWHGGEHPLAVRFVRALRRGQQALLLLSRGGCGAVAHDGDGLESGRDQDLSRRRARMDSH